MGHRKQSAPRHGSLSVLPRARVGRMVARVRYWPSDSSGEPRVLGFAGYKAGMTHAMLLDNREFANTRGKELQVPVTILETPPLRVVAVRAYTNSDNGPVSLTEVWAQNLPREASRRISTLRNANFKSKIDDLLKLKERIIDVRPIVCTQPWTSGFAKKTPEVFELPLSGELERKIAFSTSLLGKEVPVSQVIKEGQYVDVFSVTKGKGFASTIKRFHVRIMARKSNKTRRGIGTMGPKSPNNVMYTIPRAGQLGFWQRLVRNVLVLKVGTDGNEATLNGGFLRYGVLKSNYVMLLGHAPGPAKRLVRIRVSARKEGQMQKALQIAQISLDNKQGV